MVLRIVSLPDHHACRSGRRVVGGDVTINPLHGVTSRPPAQGCHNILGAGADGVMQAMVLSMGALKFSNQHLEFGMEPKDMHRDYMFRRVNRLSFEI